jgi:hypothetical protein
MRPPAAAANVGGVMRLLAAIRAALRSIWADAAAAAALVALGQYEVWSTVRYDGAPSTPGRASSTRSSSCRSSRHRSSSVAGGRSSPSAS